MTIGCDTDWTPLDLPETEWHERDCTVAPPDGWIGIFGDFWTFVETGDPIEMVGTE